MSKGTYQVTEPQTPEPIPPGMYPAKLVKWEEKDTGQYGHYLRLEFEITDGKQAGTKRSFIASAKLTKGKNSETTSKLFQAVTSLLAREPQPNEEISFKDLLKTKCQILVEDRPGSEEGWQDITKIMPVKN